ncbi:MAG: T9SS type A sorting domain-containing protein [Bacteroidales bacterium]
MKNTFTLKAFIALSFLFVFSFANGQKEKPTQGSAELAPLSKYDSIMLVNLPKLTLPESYKGAGKPELPMMVDNSTQVFWRPVFAQVALECGQASSIGLGFTYAINRERNVSGSDEENQYATHFTWNFTNGGNGWYGVSYFHSLEIVKTLGNPNVITYGGTTSPSPHNKWMSGYDNYYESMKNRISEVYQIDVSTAEGIETAKHWFFDHLENSEVGGVANFYAQAQSASITLPAGTPEAGKYVQTSWGSANHAMTIAGYHDSICWDYNGDGQYTNHLDLNGDGIITPRDWEIGGFKFANTYSGGPNYGNNGFCYMTYKSAADAYGSGGIWNSAIHVVHAKANTDPLLTAKITLKHTSREMIRVRMGVSTDLAATSPDYIIGFPIIDFQGNDQYMQGGTTNEDHKIIEFGLDLTPLINIVGAGTSARYFLLVDERDPSGTDEGEIVDFSIIDYTEGTNEIPCGQSNVSLIDNSTTKLWVNHKVEYEDVVILTDTLPAATVYEPYSAMLEAEGGTDPYYWDFDRNFTETNYTSAFPMVNAQQLNPGSNYTIKQLDFPFPFYGEEFEQVRVYTDGYLQFGENFSWPYTVYDFFQFTKNKRICPFWADLNLYSGNNDGVWYAGDDESATFRWKASVNGYQSSSQLNFAVQLFNNGDIKFFYGNTNNYPEIEWLSGVSSGDNIYYQFTEVNNDLEIPSGFVCDLAAFQVPDGFQVNRFGELSGFPNQVLNDFPFKFRVRDENNITESKVVYLSTDGANYLVIDDYSVIAGDDDVIEFGETVYLTVHIKSLGEENISGAEMMITCGDEYVTLNDSLETLGDFAPEEVKVFTNAFEFDVNELVPDGHELVFDTQISDNTGDDWNSHMYLTAHSAELFLSSVSLDDGENGALDPGETADLIVDIINLGGATANNITALLSSSDPHITIDENTGSVDMINSGGIGSVTFTITADDEVTVGYAIDFMLDITADLGIASSGTFSIIAGQLPVLIIDLDPNTSSGPAMEETMTNLGVGVDYVTEMPANPNLYSTIFLCLGIYSNNHVLTNDEGIILANYLEAGRNLYIEGGDTWSYDPWTPVHEMFGVDPDGDGTSDLVVMLGQEGTITEDMEFSYEGENSYIDHINPISPAYLLFENQFPNYGVTIANETDVYKTIAVSYEFGGLTDGTSPSTKEDLMTAYLDFFGIFGGDLAAGFEADTTVICNDETVAFSDLSAGNVISWNWVFEGGDPATSSEQNPVVAYLNPGTFNVSLTISDGSNTNTIIEQDYILVYAQPGIPATPIGDDTVCTNLINATSFFTTGGPDSDSYSWEILPSEAGSISGSGTYSCVVEWTESWQGTATLHVRGVNEECGEGEFSDSLAIVCYVCTGLEVNESLKKMDVFPNPSGGTFFVRFNESIGFAEIVVTNMMNEIVYKENLEGSKGQNFILDLNAYSAGIYFMEIKTGNETFIKKLIMH